MLKINEICAIKSVDTVGKEKFYPSKNKQYAIYYFFPHMPD